MIYRKLKFITALWVVLGLAPPAMALEAGLIPVPVFTEAGAQAEVTYDPATELFTYNYTITNPPTNTGEVYAIDIDITKPRNRVNLSSEGLTIFHGFITDTFDESLAIFGDPEPMVPVGIQLPPGWYGYVGARGFAGFSSSTGTPNILPGETKGGFGLISRGLPAIREIEIEPEWLFLVENIDEVTPEEEQRAREIEDSLPFRTKTIGPTAPPESSKKIVEMIQGYIDESETLGWLIDSTLANSLRDKMNVILQFIVTEDIQQAITTTEEFINLVDQASSSQITSEAHGLLFYNGDYLKNLLILDIPPVIILDLSPIKATLPIGETHTITATLTEDDNPMEGFFVNLQQFPLSPYLLKRVDLL